MAEYSWKTLMEPKHENCNLSIKSWDLLECWWSYSVGNITNCVQFECGCVCKHWQMLPKCSWKLDARKKCWYQQQYNFVWICWSCNIKGGSTSFNRKSWLNKLNKLRHLRDHAQNNLVRGLKKQSWNECSNEYVKNRPNTIQMIQNDSSEQFSKIQHPIRNLIRFLMISFINLGHIWENHGKILGKSLRFHGKIRRDDIRGLLKLTKVAGLAMTSVKLGNSWNDMNSYRKLIWNVINDMN